MKLIYTTLFATFLSLNTYSQTRLNNLDYSIVFSGDYQNDIIGLTINNKFIFDDYNFSNVDSVVKGNLSLTQKEDYLEITFNSQIIKKQKIKFKSNLEMEVSINSKIEKVLIDLRKGKIIVIEYNRFMKEKPVSIEQIQEPVILQ